MPPWQMMMCLTRGPMLRVNLLQLRKRLPMLRVMIVLPVVKILAAPGMGTGVEPPILLGVPTVAVGDTLVGTGIGLTGVEILTMAVGRGIVVGVSALGDNEAVGQQVLQVILVLNRRDRIMRARVAPRANPALPPARAESPLLRRTLIAVLRRLPFQQVVPPPRMERRVWIHQRETKRLAKALKRVKSVQARR